ncbi:MAG: hypothetical protein Q9208_002432 [Pyrenodesmia sp. 3 TL-2023]
MRRGRGKRGNESDVLETVAKKLNELEAAGTLDIQGLNILLEPPLFISRATAPLYGPSMTQQRQLPTPSATDTTNEPSNASRETSIVQPTVARHTDEQQSNTSNAHEETRMSFWSTSTRQPNTPRSPAIQPEPESSSGVDEEEGPSTSAEHHASRKRTATDDRAHRAKKILRKGDGGVSATAAEAREILGLVADKTYGQNYGQNPREQRVQMAKEAFMKKWGKKTKAIGDWKSLEQYTYITKGKSYEPYEELDDMMGRVWEIGRARVQVQFRKSVHAWIQDHTQGANEVEIPQHLRKIQGLDSRVFQDLYVNFQLCDRKTRLEGSSRLLARWASVRLVDAYDATIRAVDQASKQGKIKLAQGETTRTKAKAYTLQTMYMTDEEKAKNIMRFDNLMKRGKLWHTLVQQYQNYGILAMIPEDQTEVVLRYQSRWPALIDILKLLRPDFNGPRLRFYSQVIDRMGRGEVPSQSTLSQLDNWTSPARSVLSILDPHQPHTAEEESEQSLYSSKEDENYVRSLPELDRENAILERCAKIQQAKHDNTLAADFH